MLKKLKKIKIHTYHKNLCFYMFQVRKYICKQVVKLLTSLPPPSLHFPDQNMCEQVVTPRHWSGFLRSFEAARAHWVLKGPWFSSLKQVIFSNVEIIRVMAANWALLSLISSS